MEKGITSHLKEKNKSGIVRGLVTLATLGVIAVGNLGCADQTTSTKKIRDYPQINIFGDIGYMEEQRSAAGRDEMVWYPLWPPD